MSRKILSSLLAGAVLATMTAVPASAQSSDPGIVDVVVDVSGTTGFDSNPRDYDLLREALIATGLDGAVAASNDITVFAPHDRAFKRLARDLGWQGGSEASAFAFLAEATGFESAENPGILDDVLLYHVAPGAETLRELRSSGHIDTLQGDVIELRGRRVIDADLNSRDARVTRPSNIDAANGIIHTVNRVLRPVDLPPITPSAVEVIISTSGDSGTDNNGSDYDLLREALTATGLIDAVNAAEDVTIFAPRDGAFKRLARDLGWQGGSEASAFAFLVEATGFESAENPGILDDVLLYHIAPKAQRVGQLKAAGSVSTLQGGELKVRDTRRVVDADRDDRNARIRGPRNIDTTNGIIHTVDRVLRPIDL